MPRRIFSNAAPHHSTGPGIVVQWAAVSATLVAMAATLGYGLALYRVTALAEHKVVLALWAAALEAAALGAVAFEAVEFIVYPELWRGGGHMGVIFTNSNAVSNKFCLLYVRSQELMSPQIREQAEQIREQKHSS
jgi:hypothetical protein